MRILTCENISASYGAQKVLDGISFFVENGQCLSILGENGAGKSTLLKCLLGLIKIDSGKIDTHGFSFCDTGYLPQQTEVLRNFPATVFEVVLSGCLNMRGMKPLYSKKEKAVAEKNLERLEISGLKKRNFGELSGGQKQKVLLARALCSAKKMLILDEPTAGLDRTATAEMYELINKLKQDDMAILMVSHDTNSAVRVSERILHIGSGTDSFFGTREEYLKSPYSLGVTGVEKNG